MNLEIKKNLRRAAKFYTDRWRYDRRIRWFAKVDGRWLPMTPFYKSVACWRASRTDPLSAVVRG